MADGYKYETTCFIDKNDMLTGKFHINEKCYIDFDAEDIFVDEIKQKISSTDMRLLSELIKRMPNVVSYEKLFILYYGENEYYGRESDDKQILRNFQNRISKFIPIKAKINEGYKILLNKKIKKFPQVSKEDIYEISELFPECYSKHTSHELDFSLKFFNSGARKAAELSKDKIYEESKKISALFEDIVDIKICSDFCKCVGSSDNFLNELYENVVQVCKNANDREILEITGPLGAYKNRIMQYLYLMIFNGDNNIIPFYVNIAAYEKSAENSKSNTVDVFIENFNADMMEIESITKKSPNKIPFIMLDGIRDFSCGREALYYNIKESLKKINCKIAVCIDSGFTVNRQHVFNVHPLSLSNSVIRMNIKSMSLNNRQKSISFIKKCIDMFNVSINQNVTPDLIYDNLVRLNFISVDAYWLVKMLNTMQSKISDNKMTIADIYTEMCLSFLGSHDDLESASELAFSFEFGSMNLNVEQMYYDKRWKLIRKHRSVLDFLIARYYIRKISELDFDNKNIQEITEDLSFFNMVLQKNITRFVTVMINGNDEYENKIMIIAGQYYDTLSLFGKSELTFWMARLNNPKRRAECVKLLKRYNTIELKRYNQDNFDSIVEKRDSAFLIRGITVSLIYENDKEALKYYLNSLLSDKIANSVNRGFHLEYYGDKPYIPNRSLLDFEDDITAGENTLTVLCLSLDRRIRRRDGLSLVAPLEVMTICNLIQARIESPSEGNCLDVKPYINRCIRYIEWIIQQKTMNGLVDVAMYFMWMHEELTKLKDMNHPVYSDATLFNLLNNARDVKRTGWVKSDISNPENIVEHMYNCWLIGTLYLPDNYDDDSYDKNVILQMLLIHDLGETVTGDINRPEKIKNQRFYDNQENRVMFNLLLNGTFPNMANLSLYLERWKVWNEEDSLNYSVAKDIDNIQTIYQFCIYFINERARFSDDDVVYWLSGIEHLYTEIGKNIADSLIISNPIFAEALKIYHNLTDA